MVQFWHQLGFVSQVNPPRLLAGGLPFFVEDERGKIHASSRVKPPPSTPRSHKDTQPPLIGGPNQPIKTPKRLRQHLQSAIAVELSTIPLYLFAQYTVKVPQKYANDPRYVDPVVSAVKSEEIDLSLYPHTYLKLCAGVVTEEMLHLSLAGNILKAIGGEPKLYDPDVIPVYPGRMLHRVPKLTLWLREMTKKNLDTFIAVCGLKSCAEAFVSVTHLCFIWNPLY